MKTKIKIIVNNKLKGALGSSEFKGKGGLRKQKPTGKIEINVKKHKGDKAELASTIKHEIMHVKHPKMTEKEVYKRTAKTKVTPQEQQKLLAKLGNAKTSQKARSTSHKFKVGSLIEKMNERKIKRKSITNQPSKRNLAIVGMV